MSLTRIYYLHEIGGKKNQEDYIWPAPGTATPANTVFIVCDGVGGSDNGEVASRMIAQYMGSHLLQTPPEQISPEYINHLLENARQELVAHAQATGLNKDMATTFSALVLFSNKALVAWCGDSRVYHIRNGQVLYKTADHSLVNTLVKNGDITPEEAINHPQKNVILKAITGDGSPASAETHWIGNLAAGDFFMLCTDGLLENITENDLNILMDDASGTKDIIAFIQEKCFGKTRDNYSMYLLQVDAPATASTHKKKSAATLWLAALVVAAAASAWLYFTHSNAAALPLQVNKDSVFVRPAGANPDTFAGGTRATVTDTEALNREDTEKKIVPAPLQETTIADSAVHKKSMHKHTVDSVYVNPQTLIQNSHAAQHADSSVKQHKSQN